MHVIVYKIISREKVKFLRKKKSNPNDLQSHRIGVTWIREKHLIRDAILTMISSARKYVNKQFVEYEFSEFTIHKDNG